MRLVNQDILITRIDFKEIELILRQLIVNLSSPNPVSETQVKADFYL